MRATVRRNAFPIYLLFIASGACALVYETVWLRLLAIYCGNTTFAATAVLTAFMAGLAIGSWLIGRVADESPQPLRIYALMELLIAVYAYLMPDFVVQFKPALGFFTNTLRNHFFPLNLGRFALVFALLILPTAMMGGTLPALVKALGGEREKTARRLALLYALNTLGGAIGAALAGFWSVGALGLSSTQHWAVLVNLLIAATAYGFSRWGDYSSAGVPPIPLAPPTIAPGSFLVVCFGLAGFAALAYEIVCLRLLLFLLPYGYNNVYVFSTVLVTFLGGIALGGVLISRWVERLRNPLRTLSILQILLALATAASLPILSFLMKTTPNNDHLTFQQRALYSFLYCLLILLPPTALMGASLPLYGRLGMANYARLGTDVGRIYAANTAGNIAGAFLGGFVMIPLFGIQKSFALVSLIYLLVGTGLAGAASPADRRRRYGRLAVALGIGVTLLLVVAPFGRLVWKEGAAKVVYHREGISSTLLVLQNGEDAVLQINDFVAAGSDYEHLRNQRMMAYLPLLVHAGEPKQALVICLGTGTTAGALAAYPPMEKVTVVEIDEQVPGALSFFSQANLGLEFSAKKQVVIEDGRAFMEFDKGKYDIVTGEPLHPKRAGTTNLYTREFYQNGRDRLAKGGIFAQWVPYHALSLPEMASILKTFVDVFPHSYLWMGEQFILLGTDEPLHASFPAIAARMKVPEVYLGLHKVDSDDPYEFVSGFLLWDESLRRACGGSVPIVDNLPGLEFSRDQKTTNLPGVFLGMRQNYFYSVEGIDPKSPEVRAAYASQVLSGRGITGMMDGRYAEAVRFFEDSERLYPGNRRNARWLAMARQLAHPPEPAPTPPPPPIPVMPERPLD